ncbi:tetratricopeptide repeat protein [Paludisphaera rhizosphaerae]|uniref:tetratricopeptide repeat protein n=1 Tax=Paludisphaera rhizosphaerae TaxID=2711216 RepID=UPI0013EDB6EA|nr:tetratricopeptide repeat protein [Paludisphaera rhizosphaerae]
MSDRAVEDGSDSWSASASGDVDPALARLFSELMERLDAGEAIDVEAVVAEHPQWAEEIRRLTPALLDLSALRGDAPAAREFGGFRIDREIGRGGMGIVYEAEQTALGRRVALKVLLSAAAMDAHALRRFQLEAQVAGLLQHPRIVPVYDVGVVQGTPYYAMRLVRGGSLADLVAAMRAMADDPPDESDRPGFWSGWTKFVFPPGGGRQTAPRSVEGDDRRGVENESSDADPTPVSPSSGPTGHLPPPGGKAPDDVFPPGGGRQTAPRSDEGDDRRGASNRTPDRNAGPIPPHPSASRPPSPARGEGRYGPDSLPTADPHEEESDIGELAVGLLSGRFAPEHEEDEAPGAGPPLKLRLPVHGSLGSRSYIRTVARLGVQVAEALGYAHEQGVTHRDVKPANLLLDRKGDVWVVDFGMADVQGAGGLTVSGDLPGTLRYMSPEQATGRRALVDRRTDVYALGATLYELLTLRPAATGQDRQEILRRVVEEEPTPIRRLNPAVPVDLATAVAKAMAKNPADRYDTAARFAEDLRRFLDGRPIAARPVGAPARLWRWCRRKPILAGLSAALAASLILGLAGAAWSWRRSVIQERRLAASAAKLAAVDGFLIRQLLELASPEHNPDGGKTSIREALDRAAAEVGPSLAGQPEVEAAVRLEIGKAYHGMGDYAASERHLRTAYDLLRTRPEAPADDALAIQAELAHTLDHLTRWDEAEPLLVDAVARSRRVLGPGAETSLRASNYLAAFLNDRGRLNEAEAAYRRTIAESEGGLKKLPPEIVLSARGNLADILRRQKRLDEAEALLRPTIDDSIDILGRKNPATLSARNNLAAVLESRGEYQEAERIFREDLEINREVLGPEHVGTLTCGYNLAHVLIKLGRLDEAEPLLRSTLETQRRVMGPEHPATLFVAAALGDLLRTRGRLDEAESLLRSTLEAQRRILGPDHADVKRTAARLESLAGDRAVADRRRP